MDTLARHVTRVQQGDPNAYGEIVRRFQDMAVGYAYSQLRDFHLAEDAAQEAFVQAYCDIGSLQDVGAFAGWFRRIVHKSADRIRRRTRDVIPIEAAAETPSPEPSAEDALIDAELRDRVLAEIDRLPPGQSAVTTLFYISGHSQREIGDFLGVSVNVVKTRLHRSRQRLTERMVSMARDTLRDRRPSRDDAFEERISALTQPMSMRSTHYVYGVEPIDGNDGWALMRAAAAGDMDEVRRLVEKDCRLIHAERWYQMPLHFAVREGQAEVVRYLLDQGAEIERSRAGVYSTEWALEEARRRGYEDVREALTSALRERYGYDPECADLSHAVRDSDFDEIEWTLAEKPALIRAADVYGATALHRAASDGDLSLVGCLVDHGADIDAERSDGKTPLLVALTAGPGNLQQKLAMSRAAQRRHSAVAGYLLGRGARYDLTAACVLGDMRRVRGILDDDPDAGSRLGACNQSPLYYAAMWGHEEIVKLLLACGADPNRPEKNAARGKALFEACAMNHVAVVKVLLEHGADPNAQVDSSGSCLTIAEYGHPDEAPEIQELLRQYGARAAIFTMAAKELRAALENDDPRVRGDEEFVKQVFACGDTVVLELLLDRSPDVVRCLPVLG
ncbi:sigma-70 family RNA polymerase sigma factor, partial [Candidatus Poribacteria bacterium]|nr:sigma-70 family RNA polymerase sigma factor [Candidatus Poribacteria bacterium]